VKSKTDRRIREWLDEDELGVLASMAEEQPMWAPITELAGDPEHLGLRARPRSAQAGEGDPLEDMERERERTRRRRRPQ
jgi:hypothetical protein